MLKPAFRRAARFEFEEATVWYESQQAGLGEQFVAEIERALSTACDAPQQFPTVLADVRRVRVKRFPYSIFFRVRNDQFIVLSIFHIRRDPHIWQRRS